MKNIFNFNINYQWRLLFRKGFWKLISMAFRAWLLDVYITSPEKNGIIVSVGTNEPDKKLWSQGFSASFLGKILWQSVIVYERPKEKSLMELSDEDINIKLNSCIRKEAYEEAVIYRDELSRRNVAVKEGQGA